MGRQNQTQKPTWSLAWSFLSLGSVDISLLQEFSTAKSIKFKLFSLFFAPSATFAVYFSETATEPNSLAHSGPV